MKRHLAALVIVAIALASRAAAATMETAADARVLGGQYAFGSQKSALGGNAALSVVPAVRLDQGTLFPVFSTSYQGTKQVVDLVGAGTLFQEQMDTRGALRAVFDSEDGRWRIKPNVGLKQELLKETKDERWGRGLFDYRKVGGGVEFEYLYRDPYSVRFSLDDFYTVFPNYASLESQAPADLQGQPLARELAGRRVLDHHGQTALLAVALPAGRVVADGRLALQHARYAGQHLIGSAGAFGEGVRDDFLASLGWTLRMPMELNTDRKVLGSLSLGAAYNGSDQNSYDARRFRFLPGYYDYGELTSALGGKLLFGDRRRPVTCSADLSWIFRSYPHRPPQDASGLYLGGHQSQHLWTLAGSVAYPLAERWSLLLEGQAGRASSNQHYEQAYAYNYTVTNMLFGVAYEY